MKDFRDRRSMHQCYFLWNWTFSRMKTALMETGYLILTDSYNVTLWTSSFRIYIKKHLMHRTNLFAYAYWAWLVFLVVLKTSPTATTEIQFTKCYLSKSLSPPNSVWILLLVLVYSCNPMQKNIPDNCVSYINSLQVLHWLMTRDTKHCGWG